MIRFLFSSIYTYIQQTTDTTNKHTIQNIYTIHKQQRPVLHRLILLSSMHSGDAIRPGSATAAAYFLEEKQHTIHRPAVYTHFQGQIKRVYTMYAYYIHLYIPCLLGMDEARPDRAAGLAIGPKGTPTASTGCRGHAKPRPLSSTKIG